MLSRRQILRAGVAGGTALIFPPAMAATQISVRTKEELNTALARCRGGEEVVVVAPLTNVVINNANFPAERPVTIRGHFLVEPKTDSKFNPALQILNSSSLRLADCDIEGYVRGRYDRWGRVLLINQCHDVSIDRCRIHNCWEAIWAYQCDRLSINDCDLTDLGPFGMQLSTINGFSCRRNAIAGFNIFIPPENLTAGEHPDAIMFMIVPRWNPESAWAEAGSRDIVIEDNFILGDPDNKPQGIFFRDTARTGGKFTNVTIRGNELWGTMWGGISLESCHDYSVEDNRVRCLSEPGRPVPGGNITHSNIRVYGEEPRTLSGNSSSIYAVDDVQRENRGVRENGCVPFKDAEAAYAKWRADRAAGKLPSQTRS